MLEGQLSQLKTALNEINIKVEDFKIELNDKQAEARFTQKEGFQNHDRDSRGSQHFEGKRENKSMNGEPLENEDKFFPLTSTSLLANNEVNYMV